MKREFDDWDRGLAAQSYAVRENSAWDHARVISLSFSAATAAVEDDLKLLDVGWCDVFVRSHATDSSVNYIVDENKRFVPGMRFVSEPLLLDM